MKNSIITRSASFLLVIGFFISCAGSKFSAENLIDEGNYQQALNEISTEIEKNPSAYLFFQQGKIYGLMAEESDVQNRELHYQSMISSFDSVNVYKNTIDNEEDWSAHADSITNFYWEMEQTNGLRAYELEADGSDLKAISHFKNAISIKPDLVESYKSLSIAQYNNNDIESAIETLEVIESKENVSPDVFQSLGFLHLEVGNPEESIRYYKKADQEPIKNKSIAYGLVNAYISQNRTYEAVSFLSEIVVEFPNDSKLHNVYGTQLYEQVSELFVSLRTSYAQNDTTNATNLRVEIEGVSEKAENELIEAYKMENTNIDYVESLAVFYNNMAGNYFTVYEVAFQEDKNVINTKAIELTDFAITYYSKLLELNPDSNNYSVKLENLKNLKASWTEQE